MATQMHLHTTEYCGATEKIENMERHPKSIRKINNLKDDQLIFMKSDETLLNMYVIRNIPST